jgi:hypothetical protein
MRFRARLGSAAVRFGRRIEPTEVMGRPQVPSEPMPADSHLLCEAADAWRRDSPGASTPLWRPHVGPAVLPGLPFPVGERDALNGNRP